MGIADFTAVSIHAPAWGATHTIIIEPADAEEAAMIEEGMREYEKDPSTFTPWKTVKKEMGLA